MKSGKKKRAVRKPTLVVSAGLPAVFDSPALWARAATQLRVAVDDLEKATILGQIADFLLANPNLGRRVAFKGGAVMHLVDGSPRLSADLDGVLTAPGTVTARMIRAALTTTAARRVVLRISDIIFENPKSIDVHFVVCRPLSRQREVTIRIQIGWRYPPLLQPDRHHITLRTGAVLRLPVLARRERVAEKVRAFTERGLARDAFDLYYYGTHVLTDTNDKGLARLVQTKLEQGELPNGANLHDQFDEALRLGRVDWQNSRSMVLTTDRPNWPAVERVIRQRFKSLLAQTLQRP